MVLASIGIVLALLVLVVMAYRGHSVIVVAPVAALVGVVFSGAPVLASYTQIFMPAAGGFVINYFPLFLLGAVFGSLMTASGYADQLAVWVSQLVGPKKAILATTIATALLTYGGISAWVIAFTMVPIARSLFRQANIPRKLMPAAIALGVYTFGIAALPGTPQIHNVIPTRYFGTTTFAAPVFSIIGSALILAVGLAWLQYRAKKLTSAGEVYAESEDAGATSDGADCLATTKLTTKTTRFPDRATTLRGLQGLLPVLIVVGMNMLFVYVFSRIMDFSYLADEKYGATDIGSVTGIWSVVTGMATAIIVIFLMKPGMFSEYITKLSEGAKNSVVPALTTASEVGFGAVIASLAVFTVIQNSIFDLSDNPIIIGILITAVISAITGSSSGGLSITLDNFGEQLAQLAADQGISLELMHRIIAMASVSFDTLPHNGGIITLLLVCGIAHREAYKDIAMVTITSPLVGVAAVLGLSAVLPTM